MKQSRRDFVMTGAASILCASALLESRRADAQMLHLPLGLQLYSVRELLPKDFAGTLKDLGALGYREVEAAGYYNHSAAEVKQAMAAAGLKLVSAHYAYDALRQNFDEILAFHHELGVSHLICSWPGKDPAGIKKSGAPAPPEHKRVMELNPRHPLIERMKQRQSTSTEASTEDGLLNNAAEVLLGLSLLAEGSELPDPARFNRAATEVLGQVM